jgi:hypothetical protein
MKIPEHNLIARATDAIIVKTKNLFSTQACFHVNGQGGRLSLFQVIVSKYR